jgi:hypothetical protein
VQSDNPGFRPSQIPVRFTPTGNALVIGVNAGNENADSIGDVTLDVSTPPDTNVNIQAASALVTIEDVKGQIKASTDDGTITAANDELSNLSDLKSETGNIRFTGSFDAKGTYQFSSESGTIDISVPENSSFRLNTTGINSADITNEFGSNVVGNHPDATVAIHTEGGSVALHKY